MCRGPGETLGVRDEYTYVEQREIMLESLDCTKIEVELLTCYCETRQPSSDDDDERDLYTIFVYSFFSGAKGEIYQMYSPPPFIPAKCNDSQTYTIFKTIVRGAAYATDAYQRPRLRGIERIFEEISYTGFNVEFQSGRTGARTQYRWNLFVASCWSRLKKKFFGASAVITYSTILF
jgi:hypothetical protein